MTKKASGVTDPWEHHAAWWQREYTDGADPEYTEQILPLVTQHLAGSTSLLDVGCGEGQVARHLVACGAVERAVGVDPTVAQLTLARERGGGVAYARATASGLPFGDGAFDAVVVCLVLEHVNPLQPVIDEIARVLRAGGTFLMLLNHPLLQAPGSGFVDDQILEEQYWRIGPYLADDVGEEEVVPGIVLPFVHRPLSRYVNAMAARGLLIEHMDEPVPPPGFVARAPEYAEATSIPRLLVLVTSKRA